MKFTFAQIMFPKWSVFLVLLIGLYLLIMFRFNVWNFGGVSHMKPLFADTHIVLAAAECHQKGYDVFRENPCDALNRPHCYSRLWFVIGRTGLTTLHTNVVGGFVITTFLLLSVTIVRPQKFLEFLFFSLLLFSPSVMLGVERGNMDLLVFSLITLSGYLLFSKKKHLRYLSYPLLFICAFLKFYPVASFGMFIYYFKQRKQFWLLALMVMVVFGVFLWMTYEDFFQLRNNIPRPNGWLSFGISSLFGSITKGKLIYIASFFTTCIIVFLACILSSRIQISNRTNNSVNQAFFLLGSFNLLFCFFINTNYDYRTVFYILVVPYIFDLLRCESTPIFTRRLLFLFFVLLTMVVWFNFMRYALEFIGKTSAKANLTQNLTWAFFILKQMGSWGSIAILMAITIEIVKKPFQDNILGPFFQFFKIKSSLQ